MAGSHRTGSAVKTPPTYYQGSQLSNDDEEKQVKQSSQHNSSSHEHAKEADTSITNSAQEPSPASSPFHNLRSTDLSSSDNGGSSPSTSIIKGLSWLDRLLALWILVAIIVGIVLGNFVPGIEEALQRGRLVEVSVPIAVGLLVMMYPILCRVRFESLHRVFFGKDAARIWVQLAFSVVLNWIVAPLVMLGLAWAFLPDEPGLREGLILVGLARCIAMVLIWTNLAGGSTDYCAILVAVNSLLQLVLYAPLAVLFIRIIGHSGDSSTLTIGYRPVATSVGLFLGIPLGAALLTRLSVRTLRPAFYDKTLMPLLAPLSLIGLLYTIIVLFAAQGRQVVHQVVSVVRVAAPLVVYFVLIFGVTLWLTARCFGFGYELAATQSFTAASNNFELAIAVAAATYGPQSDQALASTVGPLIEVPVLLALVYAVKWARRRGWLDDNERQNRKIQW